MISGSPIAKAAAAVTMSSTTPKPKVNFAIHTSAEISTSAPRKPSATISINERDSIGTADIITIRAKRA